MNDPHVHIAYAAVSTGGAVIADMAAPLVSDPTARMGIWAAGISLVGVAVANSIKAVGGAVIEAIDKWSKSGVGRLHQQLAELQRTVEESQIRVEDANKKLHEIRDEAHAEGLRHAEEVARLTGLLEWTQDQWRESLSLPARMPMPAPRHPDQEPVHAATTTEG